MTGILQRLAFKIIVTFATLFFIDSGGSQNIVVQFSDRFTANPVRLTDMDVSEFIWRVTGETPGACFHRTPRLSSLC